MAFSLTKPIKGLGPADSIVISMTTAIGVAALYGMGVGPLSDVHMTNANDGNIAAATKKAGWKSVALVAAVTLLTRDVNVIYLGGGMIIFEHIMYLHADLSEPTTGRISTAPGAYVEAGVGGAQLSVVSG